MAPHCLSCVAGYSLIYNPWLCLIFEAMESVTSSLSFTAAVTYAAKLSTTTTDSSIQGLLGGLYFGVGKKSDWIWMCNGTSSTIYSVSILLPRNQVNHHYLPLPWRLNGDTEILILKLCEISTSLYWRDND
jgi:hypothetical protein